MFWNIRCCNEVSLNFHPFNKKYFQSMRGAGLFFFFLRSTLVQNTRQKIHRETSILMQRHGKLKRWICHFTIKQNQISERSKLASANKWSLSELRYLKLIKTTWNLRQNFTKCADQTSNLVSEHNMMQLTRNFQRVLSFKIPASGQTS